MNKSTKRILIGTVILVTLAVVAFLTYEYFNLRNQLNNPDYLSNLQSEQQTMTKERILSRLSAIMILPDEINPKIATISNIDELKSENAEFYKNAVNGDTLVLYSELAIIFRDSSNKIVNIAPILQESTTEL